ncbi:glycosyltransferase family 4 protein [Candidatus Dojkabacteria bacterium]|uniref:Glycosyltransferase family 4 protein n=1 Tax=Candidatus Dojkabacteria bacterium TaxID=2099670 RepID=A0A955RL92_9BACT|nr:glycosyltransferase family 4 protein [Candidatus Dojkabacteria bacterium]
MKIGILSERLLRGFGVDLVIHNQANGLAAKGHNVTVYVQNYDKTFLDQNYKVVVIDSPLLFNPLKTEYTLLKRKIKFFRKEKNDAWIIHAWPFFVLTPFLKGKVFIYDHGTVASKGMYLKRRLVFWYQKFMSRYVYFFFSNKIITISKYIRSSLPMHTRWKSTVIYNGTNHYTSGYTKDESKILKLKEKLAIRDSDFVMLYVGRLNHEGQPYKGVNDLIDIYQHIQDSDIKLIMAGFGSDEDRINLEKKGIIAINNVPDHELLMLYDICNIYVSATKWEGFNLPMVEAQSFGKIPVVYNIGPHNEILNSGKDSFVVKNQKEFIEKVKFLYDNPDFRADHAQDAINNAEKYTWQISVDKLNDFLKQYE